MHPVINNVLDTYNCGLKIVSNRNKEKPWDVVCLSNRDYAGEPAMRSISGFILHRIVTLSSSEAEWAALL